jgi:hypothetical protein
MEYLRMRCRICDECWVWSLSAKKDGRPIIFFRRPDENGLKKDKGYYVRHLTWWIKHGMRPTFEKRVMVSTCETPNCVNPDHLKYSNRSAHYKRISGYQGSLIARKNMSKSRRANSKLSDKDVADIRESELPVKDLAARYKISLQYVYMLKAGEWRKDYQQQVANPFAGLFAMNDSKRRAA